ncbi:hypothetical protein ILYODFUR_030768 [Ilyodon furcidens]|uniref:Ribosomal protein L7Ae/L30e/S12e/Gadd45 domain-containing protein n=1 Tax=Ilyodon furcidens TaxID=33524 RepID=A0ABV0U9V1_9TELE
MIATFCYVCRQFRFKSDGICCFSHRDPDSVSFCVLATDEQFEWDIALQIHFTLIQSFCFDNDISIVRVSDMQRLADIVGDKTEQLEDAHCVLITVSSEQTRSRGATRGWESGGCDPTLLYAYFTEYSTEVTF